MKICVVGATAEIAKRIAIQMACEHMAHEVDFRVATPSEMGELEHNDFLVKTLPQPILPVTDFYISRPPRNNGRGKRGVYESGSKYF